MITEVQFSYLSDIDRIFGLSGEAVKDKGFDEALFFQSKSQKVGVIAGKRDNRWIPVDSSLGDFFMGIIEDNQTLNLQELANLLNLKTKRALRDFLTHQLEALKKTVVEYGNKKASIPHIGRIVHDELYKFKGFIMDIKFGDFNQNQFEDLLSQLELYQKSAEDYPNLNQRILSTINDGNRDKFKQILDNPITKQNFKQGLDSLSELSVRDYSRFKLFDIHNFEFLILGFSQGKRLDQLLTKFI